VYIYVMRVACFLCVSFVWVSIGSIAWVTRARSSRARFRARVRGAIALDDVKLSFDSRLAY